jgi:hypothetical protein
MNTSFLYIPRQCKNSDNMPPGMYKCINGELVRIPIPFWPTDKVVFLNCQETYFIVEILYDNPTICLIAEKQHNYTCSHVVFMGDLRLLGRGPLWQFTYYGPLCFENKQEEEWFYTNLGL